MQRTFGILTLLFSTLAFSQECTRYMVVSVFDEKTHQGINGLEAPEFRAKLDGDIIPVASVTQTFNNRILLLVETTGSAEYPGIAALVNGMAEEARSAPMGRLVAFGKFSEQPVLMSGFLSDPMARSKAIDAVMARENGPGRKVALFDSIHEALQTFGDHQPATRSCCSATDSTTAAGSRVRTSPKN